MHVATHQRICLGAIASSILPVLLEAFWQPLRDLVALLVMCWLQVNSDFVTSKVFDPTYYATIRAGLNSLVFEVKMLENRNTRDAMLAAPKKNWLRKFAKAWLRLSELPPLSPQLENVRPGKDCRCPGGTPKDLCTQAKDNPKY